MSRPPSSLSGGEQTRATLARLVIADTLASDTQQLVSAPYARPYLLDQPMTPESGWHFNREFRARDHIAKIYLTEKEWQLGTQAAAEFGPALPAQVPVPTATSWKVNQARYGELDGTPHRDRRLQVGRSHGRHCFRVDRPRSRPIWRSTW